jgi:hypothetical protein
MNVSSSLWPVTLAPTIDQLAPMRPARTGSLTIERTDAGSDHR